MLLDASTPFIYVSSFANSQEAKVYLEQFNKQTDIVNQLDESVYKVFIISKSNYIKFFQNKNPDGYFKYFTENY